MAHTERASGRDDATWTHTTSVSAVLPANGRSLASDTTHLAVCDECDLVWDKNTRAASDISPELRRRGRLRNPAGVTLAPGTVTSQPPPSVSADQPIQAGDSPQPSDLDFARV